MFFHRQPLHVGFDIWAAAAETLDVINLPPRAGPTMPSSARTHVMPLEGHHLGAASHLTGVGLDRGTQGYGQQDGARHVTAVDENAHTVFMG
jgi:hypothetical protein